MVTDPTTVAIGCQGGGSHTAFTAGALQTLLTGLPEDHEVVAISGTSGGALCATTAWYGLLADGPDGAAERLDALWTDIKATNPVERTVNGAAVWLETLHSMGVPVPSPSPYDLPPVQYVQQHLRRILETHVEFDEIPHLVNESTPRLLLSAVDVTDGSFEIFEDAAITPERVVASTAVPTLFPAVECDETGYWDGLFAQNPPIRNFLTDHDAAAEKPDEIWIIQINPESCDEIPRRGDDITDRRNELAGNLSLNQEVDFIDTVNEWVENDVLPAEHYKKVTVRWLPLERTLSYSSKLRTDPRFVDELLAEGEQAADRFLTGLGAEAEAMSA